MYPFLLSWHWRIPADWISLCGLAFPTYTTDAFCLDTPILRFGPIKWIDAKWGLVKMHLFIWEAVSWRFRLENGPIIKGSNRRFKLIAHMFFDMFCSSGLWFQIYPDVRLGWLECSFWCKFILVDGVRLKKVGNDDYMVALIVYFYIPQPNSIRLSKTSLVAFASCQLDWISSCYPWLCKSLASLVFLQPMACRGSIMQEVGCSGARWVWLNHEGGMSCFQII